MLSGGGFLSARDMARYGLLFARMGKGVHGEPVANPGDPDPFTHFRPYLAHFCPVFSRLFAVFSILTPGFQKVAPKDPGAVP